MMIARLALFACVVGFADRAQAQWTNRYPRIAGYGHQIYLEGYELPLLTSGPIDAVESPDGTQIAFAARGWLWLLNTATGVATRLTTQGGVDSRPSWSPDGRTLVFLRDNSKRLFIVMLDLATKAVTPLVNENALLLDPVFAADGKSVFYSSSIAGDLDLWRIDIESRQQTRLTTTLGTIELHPMPTPDGQSLVYLAKARGGNDMVRRRNIATGEDRVIASGAIVSMTRGAVSPDGRTLALSWPNQQSWDLRLLNAATGGTSVELVNDPASIPLTPSWSRSGASILFSRADAQQRMHLMRVPSGGGAPSEVAITRWEWGTPLGRLRIATRLPGQRTPVAARVAVTDGDGHPIIADSSQMRFDGQNGIAFFYSAGVTEITVPAGDEITVTAVQGISTAPVSRRVIVDEGKTLTVDLMPVPVWNARANGWLSGEHHFHLNYGGPYRLAPEALLTMGRAEDLDVMTPMLANLASRFGDQELFGYTHLNSKPWVSWAQEVRSHFLGHVGLIGSRGLFWPWIWGPGYEVYSRDDRPNADALRWAGEHGGINTYVHPISIPDPFRDAATLRSIPLGFVADAVQGQVNAIELACLWSDERGSAEMWYRMLNVGVPMALTAGTDVMNNLYRTMAVGTTRVYVKPEQPSLLSSYFAALRAGRSFVSNGPLLEFTVGTAAPGQAVARGSGTQRWQLTVHSAVPVDTVEIVVNGAVVERRAGFALPGSQRYTGTITLPDGGWVAARATGPAIRAWPAMDSYAYAHTSPVWIGRIGSTDATARTAAARDLLRALDVAEQAVEIGYSDADHPRLRTHYAAARKAILAWLPAP
jgi:TolB protein